MKNRCFRKEVLLGLVIGMAAGPPIWATDLNIADVPLFLGNEITPNVMVMLDNSGSMKQPMYSNNWGLHAFNASTDYFGIFEANKNYVYNATIPVDPSAYDGSSGAAYSVAISSAVQGAFVESNCTPSAANDTCWSGRYLNWLTTRRIDSTRVVLVGGKVENRAGYDYLGNGGLQYKLLGNNERSDRNASTVGGASSISSEHSPVPNDVQASIYSPADDGAIKSSYDPYAKISIGSSGGGQSGILYDSSGTQIGEFGKLSLNNTEVTATDAETLTTGSWKTLTLSGTYTNPIVVAKPPSFNGADPALVRIKDVTSTSFDVSMQEWPYKDGNHTGEDVFYLVVEQGHHDLPNSLEIEAAATSTNEEYQVRCSDPDKTDSSTISFTSSFPAGQTPVVIPSVIGFDNGEPEAVNARAWDIGTSSFKLALQEQEDGGDHDSETIHYIAVTPGTINDANEDFILKAGVQSGLDETEEDVSFGLTSPFTDSPSFLAALQSMNDSETAVLRLTGLSGDEASLFVEEEKSCDNEVDHSDETVGYIALRGTLGYNIAVVVDNEPTGLLHEVSSDVRLGVSFYRFDPTVSDIYNSNTIEGGTLKFKIPLNPFVKKPSDTTLPVGEQGFRELDGYIGSSMDTIVDTLEHYPLVWGTTPIAENLWEVIQYFEQDDPHYSAVVSGFEDFDKADLTYPERDPFYSPDYGRLLQCANSNVLIFTDGYPYKDAAIPAELDDYDEDSASDDISDPTATNNIGTDNLDDVAYWGYCNKVTGSCMDATTGKAGNPSRDLRPLLYGDQFVRVDTVGFAGGTIRPVLQDTADNAGGNAYAAEDGLALKTALTNAFASYAVGSAASVAINTGSIQGSSLLFLARFDSADWSGNLLAFPLNADGSLSQSIDGNGNTIPNSPGWQAASLLPAHGSRHIITHDGSAGAPFRWGDLSVAQQTLLDVANVGLTSSPVLDYLRGDASTEQRNGGAYRNRINGALGDLVHSAPAYVGNAIYHYPDDMEGSSKLYSSFKATINALNSGAGRTPVVYVGGNDGMLHAFNASNGVERFAYVPGAVYSRLPDLTNPNYAHKYSVDGSPTVVDAFINNNWRTVLAAGLRGGGQAIYALDVTYPTAFDVESTGAANVLWEFTDAYTDASNPNAGNDLGFTFSRPNIARMHNGAWAAIFGNGYNNTEADGHVSTSGNAVLYIVNLHDGSLIKKIDTGVGISNAASGGRPNGLATVAPVDVDGDYIVDYIYGGDLYGNLWKFDTTSASTGSWDIAYQTAGVGIPLFTACTTGTCSSTNRQPITSRPQVGYHPDGSGYMVYFGTGQYMETADNLSINQDNQTFYAIWDKNEANLTAFDRDQLKQRKILEEVTAHGYELRITSGVDDAASLGGGSIDWNTQNGWYMDLYNTEGGNTNNYGERQVSDAVLRNGRIIFTTMAPSDDPCEYGGSGWLMELSADSGARFDFSPFDINGDGTFSEADYVTVAWDVDGDGSVTTDDKIPTSGKRSKVGIITTPGIASDPDGDKEYKYNSGSTGKVEMTVELPGPMSPGRQSWQQLLF